MKEKIDIVITWVDGNDPKWIEEKAKYSTIVSNSSSYFRDWKMLKYIFRSIEKYAPWFNNVYLITWGHIPEWLNTECQNLKIINHKDYIPSKYLPTFSSHTIELNFNKITELSENFVYFNDDTILNNKTESTDFFKNGIPCMSAVLSPIICNNKSHFENILANNMNVINKRFNKKEVMKKNKFKFINLKYGSQLFRTLLVSPWHNFVGFYNQHVPSSLCKSTIDKLWKEEHELLDATCSHKFRNSYMDVNQYLFNYYQICTGNFVPRKINIAKYMELHDYNYDDIKNEIKKGKSKLLCINDSDDIKDFENLKRQLLETLENKFPDKSKFER